MTFITQSQTRKINAVKFLIFIFRKQIIDVKSTVREMQKQRMGMIQTLEQYQDIFKCVRLEIASGSGDEEYYDLSPNNYYE